MIDPFRESDPRWQPSPTSVECGLTGNFRDFIREAQHAAVAERPKPQLPPGVYLQLQTNGWALFYPDAGYGYRRMDGDYDALLQIAQSITTEN